MERVEGARTPYEVYCFRCRVTFPIGSRQCLHCGGPVFGAGERGAAGPEPLARRPGLPIPPAEDPAEDGIATIAQRFGGLAVWALVALSALLAQVCQRQ